MPSEKAPEHPELYSLRAAAFALIFVHHFLAPYTDSFARLHQSGMVSRLVRAVIDSGSVGLDFFFCLSSFLITHLLMREYEAQGCINIGRFLARRSLRIFPLYFGFLGLTVLVLPRLIPGEHLSTAESAGLFGLCANWVCTFHGYPASVAAPLWSVSAEQQFYLLWPVLISFLTPRRIVPLALTGLAVATASRLTVLHLGLPHPAIWANTLAHLDPIAVGALCAVFVWHKEWRPSRTVRRVFLAVGLALPPSLIFLLSPAVFHGPWSLLFYPCTALACGCILAGTFRVEKANHPAALVYLGKISYGLFIFHMLAIHAVRLIQNTIVPHPHGWPMHLGLCGIVLILSLALTVGLAALSYRYFESPFLLLKAKVSAPRSGREAAARTCGAALLGRKISLPAALTISQ